MASNGTPQNEAQTVTTKPCECSLWENVTQDTKMTDCNQQVNSSKKTFLPGHDAKLKGALIRAKHAGDEVSDGRGVRGDAVTLASRFGFAAMVANATPRGKKAPAEPSSVAEVVAEAEEAEIAKDEAEAVAKVRKATTPRARRTRKVAQPA